MDKFIGIFDSGIGGLSVYQSVVDALPNENIIYFADQANCPYGVKSIEEVREISLKNISLLKEMGAKVIVVACNTATASLINNMPEGVIGVIKPTAEEALNVSFGKSIGLFATNLTVKSCVYDGFLKDALIAKEGCSDFVEFIERGELKSDDLDKSIKKHLERIGDVKTLILGCTHFKFIEEEIKKFIPDVNIINSGFPTTKVLKSYLNKNNIFDFNGGKHIFITNNDILSCKVLIEKLGISFDEIIKL